MRVRRADTRLVATYEAEGSSGTAILVAFVHAGTWQFMTLLLAT